MDDDAGTPYTSRLVDQLLDELLGQLPAVMVVGPRAVGKTTTIRRRATSVVRLDDPVESAAFVADPDAALRGLPEPVLLDEWQRAPGVLGAVRRAVDDAARPNRYLLTGSACATFGDESWPATGRVVRVPMHPMTVRELVGRSGGGTFFDRLAAGDALEVPPDPPDLRGYVDLALSGGFPLPALRLAGRARTAWLASYLDDLVEHDVEQLEEPRTRRRDPRRLRAYFEAYALNSAGVTDHKTIHDAAGVTHVTAAAYERILTDLFVVEQVPAWTSNRLKRLVKRPKRYVVDPALIAAALHVDERGVLRDGALLGRMLDTFVAAQLRPEAAIAASRPRLYHVRTADGRREVDLVAELGGELVIGIEIKASGAPDARGASHLVWLREALGDRFLAGVVFHTGPRVYELEERIVAAPISVLWG